MNTVAYVVGDVLVVVAALVVIAFMLIYHLTANWWRLPDGRPNDGGRHMMSFAAVMLLVLLVGVGGVVLGPDYSWRPYARDVALLLFVVVMTRRIVLLVRAQHGRGSMAGQHRDRSGS